MLCNINIKDNEAYKFTFHLKYGIAKASFLHEFL